MKNSISSASCAGTGRAVWQRLPLALLLAMPATTVFADATVAPPERNARQLAAMMFPPWHGDVRIGVAPEINDGRLSSFPVEGTAVTLSYSYHDPDCDQLPEKAEYCADEATDMAEIDWEINRIMDSALRDQRTITLSTPSGWDWSLKANLPLEFSVVAFSDLSHPVGPNVSNELKYTTIMLQDFDKGTNVLTVDDVQYLRPSLLSDTRYDEAAGEINETDATAPYQFAALDQARAMVHCSEQGWQLASPEQMVALLEEHPLAAANWPIGSGLYLTNEIKQVHGRDRVVSYDIGSTAGEYQEVDTGVQAPGLIVCVLTADGSSAKKKI